MDNNASTPAGAGIEGTIHLPNKSPAAPTVTPAFTPEQLQSMARHEVERGRLTSAEAEAMLKADGVAPAPELTPEQIAYDQQFPSARSPADYEMPLITGADDNEAVALDKAARGWLHDAGFDRSRGSSLLREIDRVAQQHQGMSDAQKQLYQMGERQKLERAWGNEFPAKLALARQLVEELQQKRPGVVEALEAGPGNSALVLSLIAAQAEILYNRPRGKK